MLHHVSLGDGTPVLVVHGWAPDHRLMLRPMERLFGGRPGYRRIYPDLPGMGESPAPPTIAGSDDMLGALADFVDETIGDERFLLVGESYGGLLARGLAHARPSRVLGLALICPVGPAVDQAQRRTPEHEVLRSTPGLLDGVDQRLARMFAKLAVVQTPETLREFRESVLPGVELADGKALERIGQRWPLSTEPESGAPFTAPTLIMTGRQDSSVGYLDQFDLLPHYPHATFAALDVAGHNLKIEQPALFEALMAEWLTRIEALRN